MKLLKSLKVSYKILIGFIIVALASGMVGYFSNSIIGRNGTSVIVVLLITLSISIFINTMITPSIVNAIKDLIQVVNRINLGEINTNIVIEENNEISELSKSIKVLSDNFKDQNQIMKEAGKVLGAMSANDYTLEMTGEYKENLQEFKEKINSLRTRLLSAQDAIIRIAEGDTSRLQELKKVGKRSENDKLVPALVDMMETIHNLIFEVNMLTKNSIAGNLKVRGDSEKFQGEYRNVIQGINDTLEAVVVPLNEVSIVLGKLSLNDYSQHISGDYQGEFKELTNAVNEVHARLISLMNILINISEGDISNLEDWKKIGKRSENDKILPSVIKAMQTIKNLINETGKLTDAAIDGKLDVRGDVTQFNGGYREVIQGINNTLDTMVQPLREAEKVIGAMSFNDYTLEMTGKYKGSFEEFKDKINSLRTRLLSAQDAIIRIAKGDTSRLEELKKIGKRSENDKWIPALVLMMETIHNLIDEVNMLTQNSISGNLKVRGNVDKFQGDYCNVIQGINDTLEAVVTPLNEVNKVLNKLSVNDYSQHIVGEYQGEFKELANAVNEVHTRLTSLMNILIDISDGDISKLDEWKIVGKRSENDRILPSVIKAMQTIKNLIDETGKLTEASVEGKLDARGDFAQFNGGYRKIIEGINKTLDTMGEPIKEALGVLEEMSEGNLQFYVKGNYKGDYAKIKQALNSALESFNEILNNINSAADQVASGSMQVSSSTQILSQGSTEQASAIEELTASLEEISAQTKLNAENAAKANELALKAKDDATIGNEQMKGMLNAMNDINQSSSNISKIIKVIDEIAFQTNILALNAAVEAARAGQHGKGFAVVAEEVRNLAARSANAAKETTTLIEGSIKKVDDGTKIANDTAYALNKIVEVVSKAVDLVGEIANASNEQAAAISQINQGIIEVSQVVQTNSVTSEENASSSEELSSQAELLKEMVGKFKLKNTKRKYNDLEQLNPELLLMIENMNKKNKINDIGDEAKDKIAAAKSKIILSDDEFGKY